MKRWLTRLGQILFVFSAGSVMAEETIKVGSMAKYPPYNYTNTQGVYTGIDVAIIESVLDELAIKVIHVPTPWKRAIVNFEGGQTDMLFQLSPSDERFKKWNMVGPFRENNRGYFVLHDSKIKDIKSVEQLRGLKVGTVLGYHYTKDFMQATFFTKDEVVEFPQNIHKLVRGRIDVVVENEYPFKLALAKTSEQARIRMLPSFASTGGRYVAFRKDKRGNKLAHLFREKLDEMISKGEITLIINAWVKGGQ
ncbi:MAG: transporter substrate-binding domain-containing protein [Bermanella sp.]